MPHTRTSHTLFAGLAAGLVGGLVASIGLGAVEGPRALGLLEGFDATAGDMASLAFFAAGLLSMPLLLLGGFAGLGLAALPLDLGPNGVWRALSGLWRASGARAARLSGAIWAGGLGFGVCFGALFVINRWFMATFHNQTLSSLLLALVTMLVAAAIVGVTIWAALGLGKLLSQRVPAGLASPRIPVLLAAMACLAGLLAAPVLYEEVWKALDLKAPVAVLLTALGLWACGGALGQWLATRSRAVVGAVVAGCLVMGAGLLFGTLGLFGGGSTHASMASALGGHGLLAGRAMARAHAWSDGDGDGAAAILAGGDCDDTNPLVSPSSDEIPDNGVDEDCDGEDLKLDLPERAPEADRDKPEDPAAEAPVDPLAEWRKRYNIVWILADTLRWDHTGWGGYHRPTTPNTDKLAARSTVFENGYSVSSMTPMVIGPMMTGQWPSELARAYEHFVEYDDDGNNTLAERLRDKGYLTAGSTSHWYLQRYSGLGQGFSRWSTFKVSRAKMYEVATSKEVTDKAIEMLGHLNRGELPPKGPQDDAEPDSVAGEGAKPWFLYLHYIDPHASYIHHKDFEPFGRGYIDKYDGEVRFMDHHLGRLYEALEAHDPGLKETIIVLTSDHGEGFGHKEIWMHGTNLYEPLIRAAYFIYLPGAEARRIKERASIIDVTPTLLDALGEPVPDEMRGESLLPQLALGEPFNERPIYTEMPPGPGTSHRRSLIVGDLKIIHKIKGNTWSLYDLAADPDESKNLWFVRKEDAKRMKAAYQRFRAQNVKAVEARR